MENEIWKDVIGYEGLYQVSNLGRVKSLPHYIDHNYGGKALTKGKILTKRIRAEYYSVTLSKDGILKQFKLSRLLALAFIPNPENKPEVNHINGIKTDDNLKNLEWVTRSENQNHAYKNCLQSGRKGESHHMVKITESQARKIKYEHKDLTQNQIANIYGITFQNVSNIKLGKSWKHI